MKYVSVKKYYSKFLANAEFAESFKSTGSISKLSHIKQQIVENVSKYPKHFLLAKVKYMRRG